MVLRVKELLKIVDAICPFEFSQPWDNTGLLIGNENDTVKGITIALDPTPLLIEEALRSRTNIIITHHPIIFHPQKNILTHLNPAKTIALAIKNNLNIIACHTNLDSSKQGISDTIADSMGLQDIMPLQAADCPQSNCGLGRIGCFEKAISPQECIEIILAATETDWLLEAGPHPEKVKKVAVCGGSCSDFTELAHKLKADVFITSEVKHSIARWAEENDFWLVDSSHFSSEQAGLLPFKKALHNKIKETNPEIAVNFFKQKPPLKLIGCLEKLKF